MRDSFWKTTQSDHGVAVSLQDDKNIYITSDESCMRLSTSGRI